MKKKVFIKLMLRLVNYNKSYKEVLKLSFISLLNYVDMSSPNLYLQQLNIYPRRQYID